MLREGSRHPQFIVLFAIYFPKIHNEFILFAINTESRDFGSDLMEFRRNFPLKFRGCIIPAEFRSAEFRGTEFRPNDRIPKHGISPKLREKNSEEF